jgi:hypothetical protein
MSVKEVFMMLSRLVIGDDMEAIKALDTKTSTFFDQRDRAMVKWLGTYRSVNY